MRRRQKNQNKWSTSKTKQVLLSQETLLLLFSFLSQLNFFFSSQLLNSKEKNFSTQLLNSTFFSTQLLNSTFFSTQLFFSSQLLNSTQLWRLPFLNYFFSPSPIELRSWVLEEKVEKEKKNFFFFDLPRDFKIK